MDWLSIRRRLAAPKFFCHTIVQGIFAFILLLLGMGCSGSSQFVAPKPPPDDRRPVPPPEYREINLAADNVDKLFIYQIKRILDLSRYYRMIAGKPKQAMNVDVFDEVYDSSWFTNRNGLRGMSPDEIARGPNTEEGPDTSAEWTVVRAKAQGVTPGFSIKDSRGNVYVIKFDPHGYSELSTGAEIVSTKLFYACGYNVPENYLVQFDPKILRMGKEVDFTDKEGKKRYLTEQDLTEILDRIEKLPDGRIRAVASKYLPGKPMGSFQYIGVRKDDANDFIPHEHRRELRGLRVIAAWLNHFDTKANNSLDMYLPGKYVRHYLIDFGSTLGSQGDEPMPPEIGQEGVADPDKVAKTIGTLGIYKRHWEREREILYPSIGYYRSAEFHPQKYKYILPNPAFNNASDRDGYWGAKLVMSFTEEQIRTAVAQGRYSDPEAAEYLFRTIVERRNIVGRYWFERMPPIDKIEIREDAAGDQQLCFQDLAVESGLDSAENTRYEYELRRNEKLLLSNRISGQQTCISISEWKSALEAGKKSAPDLPWEFGIRLQRGEEGNWSKWVTVFLERETDSQKFVLLGIER